MMAVAEPWTEIHDTPNKSIRQNVARRGAVLHHAAMTNLDELIRLEMGAKQLSSTATCKDHRLPRMMPLDIYRAWSLSDAYWDSALRSVETCNESTNGWTVSDASHWSLARMVAYLAQRDGFWPHRDGDPKTWTVIGHREVYSIHSGSYATACPGGMDLNLVTRRAQAILKGTATAGLNTNPLEEDDMQKEQLYRNADNGDMRIMNPSTGLEVGITSDALLTLIIGWGIFPNITKDTVAINMPANIFEFVRGIGASVRAGATVDAGAISAVVGGQVTATVKATLLEALDGIELGDLDIDALATGVADRTEARLADDFAKVNANIDDQPTTFEVTAKG